MADRNATIGEGGGGNGEVVGAARAETLRPPAPGPAAPSSQRQDRPVVPASNDGPVETTRRRPFRLRLTRTLVRTAIVRTYSGALAAGIAIVCLMALIYLFKAVFTPAALPPDFAQWQGRLEPAALRLTHVPGVTTQAGRAPMVHYHKVDRWFGPDPTNTCTAAGCHSPLPHPPTSRIAAFTNLHVTFLDCLVCHQVTNGQALEVRWVGTATGRPQEPPAVLRLTRLLEGLGSSEADAVRAQPAIVALLREMGSVPDGDPEVEDLRIQIDSSVPYSPFWRKSLQEVRRVLPLHARGEHRAKMVPDYTATDRSATARLTRQYLSAGDGTARQKDLSRQIHAHVLAKPGTCSTCHAQDAGKFNFQAAGYSPERANALRALPLARMVEQIRSGESFQLPRLMGESDGQ